MSDLIDCATCGWRHTVPCGREDCPHDAAMMACPFCGESEFDAVGLKVHLTAGHCGRFNALEVGNRVY